MQHGLFNLQQQNYLGLNVTEAMKRLFCF